MADESIDVRCRVNLPDSNSNVFVQLVRSRPERVEYKIDLIDPQQNITHVVPKAVYDIPVLHDLGQGANALRGYRMACVGVVGIAVGERWELECQVFVDKNIAGTCSGALQKPTAGKMYMFRFICDFI
jgi:hypothetical protein